MRVPAAQRVSNQNSMTRLVRTCVHVIIGVFFPYTHTCTYVCCAICFVVCVRLLLMLLLLWLWLCACMFVRVCVELGV